MKQASTNNPGDMLQPNSLLSASAASQKSEQMCLRVIRVAQILSIALIAPASEMAFRALSDQESIEDRIENTD